MEVRLVEIPIRDVVDGYVDNDEEGVVGYGGRLNIRPPYQREFIYGEKQRGAVIDTVMKGFPLNSIYWVDNEDGTYELLDGQQRIVSICQYFNKNWSVNFQSFGSLEEDEKEQFLNYNLMVYLCKGTNREKLDWFEIINIAGVKLTDQELRNAVYSGTWITDAKRYFSKTTSPVHTIAGHYMKGSPNRQAYLETALDWITGGEEGDKNGRIRTYMDTHRDNTNATELWTYFRAVIDWVESTFPNYRREMCGIPFGHLYNIYSNEDLDAEELEDNISRLMMDEDVTSKPGIYIYVLTGEEKYLNIRGFTAAHKRTVYEKQEGKCNKCDTYFDINEMEADHIIPWCRGGKTTLENCQILCKRCNGLKSGN